MFNVSYGIQGQARYTHVPSILEMVGIPYVASGPLAHSLCLDKVVTKMILKHVITSYSIHYTKLYEPGQLFQGSDVPAGMPPPGSSCAAGDARVAQG